MWVIKMFFIALRLGVKDTQPYQDSVAGSVIQASGMVLFEDGLKPGTLVVDIWSAASVRTTPVVNLVPNVRSHTNLGVQCGVEVA